MKRKKVPLRLWLVYLITIPVLIIGFGLSIYNALSIDFSFWLGVGMIIFILLLMTWRELFYLADSNDD